MKIGFLGGGVNSIAGKVHLIASQMDNKFQVVGGIFSSDKEKSEYSANIYGLKHFNSIKEMSKEVDLVVVLTPTPLHFENLKELLSYDIGIIVDKPLVSNLENIEQLNFKDKFVVVTHNYSGYPMIREIKELIQNGVAGEIKKVVINMYQESFFKPLKKNYPQKWRLKDDKLSMIELDLGVHIYHLAHFILERDFKLIHKELNSFSQFGVIDDCEMLAKSDNILLKLAISKIMLGNANPLNIEVYGEKAGIKWSQNDNENLYISYFNGKKEILNRNYCYFEANKSRYQRMAFGHPSGFIEAFANLYRDIYDSFIEFRQKGSFNNKFVYDYKHSIDSLKFLLGENR